MPSSTTRPIASAQVIWVAIEKATKALRPRPVGERQRVVGDDAHQDGHDAGHQRRAGGDGRAGSSRRPAAAEEVAVGVGREAEDQRVEHHDVGHREEGDDAAADLPPDGRAALGDLEEAVEAASRRRGLRAQPTPIAHGTVASSDASPGGTRSRHERVARGLPRRAADEARDRQPHLHRRRRRAPRRRRGPHRRGRHRGLWLVGFVALLPFYGRLAGRRPPAGGCGPAWPASGWASSAWSTAGARRNARTGTPLRPPTAGRRTPGPRD